MPDPDQLDDFMTGLRPTSPLPAAEVRRRGDRLRRRNTALAVGGGALAVALLVGGPVVALSGGHRDDSGPVAPSPTVTPSTSDVSWRQTVPKEFPLSQEMPRPLESPAAPIRTVGGRPPTADLVPVCGSQAWSLTGSVAADVASYQGQSEDQAYRTVALYSDDTAAAAALHRLEDAVGGCPSHGSLVYAPVAVDLGTEESYAFSEQARSGDLLSELTVVEVARTGNALLFDSGFGSVGGDAAVRSQTQTLLDRSLPTRTAMCVFAATPCSIGLGGSGSAAPTSSTAIPASLDLTAGIALDSQTKDLAVGPEADGVSLRDLCHTTAWPPSDGTDRSAVVISGPEYQADRELVVFADAGAAAAALQAVRQAVGGCQVEHAARPADDQIWVQENADTGYDSATFSQTYRTGLGGAVYQFIRVGSAVLATLEGGELAPQSLPDALTAITKDNAAVTSQLCVFTAAGC